MKIKRNFVGFFTILFMFLLLYFPDKSIKGAINGLIMSSDIVIPSLFPFSVCALFLYNSGVFSLLEFNLSRISKSLFSINGRNFCVFLMSFLGGYPIGAILIESLYSNSQISKRNAENMLCYCINSGPAFVIVGVGNGIFSNTKIGLYLFLANFFSSLVLALLLKRFLVFEEIHSFKNKKGSLTEAFVESTANASKAIISASSYVVLFSTIIGIISALPLEKNIKTVLSALLEITNGCVVANKNIYLISFLLGFGGFCIHFQILSILKNLKPSYIKILIGRILHGLISLFFTFLVFKLFPISMETMVNSSLTGKISSLSVPFSLSLIFMCSTFLFSLKKRGGKI